MTDIRAELEAMRAFVDLWRHRRLASGQYGDIIYSLGTAEDSVDLRETDLRALLDAVEAVQALVDGPYTRWVESGPEGGPAMVPATAVRAALTEHLGVRRKILDDLSREGYANSPHGEGFDEHLGGRDE